MACSHRLDDYVGLFCPYCGDRVAAVDQEFGQLVLRDARAERRPRYVAIIRNGKQRAVEDVQVKGTETLFSLSNEPRAVEARTPDVLMAFQDPEEKLEL